MRSLSAWWMRDTGRKLTTSRIENFHLPTQNAEEPLFCVNPCQSVVLGLSHFSRYGLTECLR